MKLCVSVIWVTAHVRNYRFGSTLILPPPSLHVLSLERSDLSSFCFCCLAFSSDCDQQRWCRYLREPGCWTWANLAEIHLQQIFLYISQTAERKAPCVVTLCFVRLRFDTSALLTSHQWWDVFAIFNFAFHVSPSHSLAAVSGPGPTEG